MGADLGEPLASTLPESGSFSPTGPLRPAGRDPPGRSVGEPHHRDETKAATGKATAGTT